MARLLDNGGAGYIGSHTMVALIEAGHEVVSLDNYSTSSPRALERVQRIAGRPLAAVEGDVRDGALLEKLFAQHAFDGVIHFAALKAVGESVAKPLAYYENNVGGTLALLRAMQAAGVRRFVFSSSATVSGSPERLPITEAAPTEMLCVDILSTAVDTSPNQSRPTNQEQGTRSQHITPPSQIPSTRPPAASHS